MNTVVKWIQKALASVFFIGYIPVMPGTLGSLLATVVVGVAYWKMPGFFSPAHYHQHLLVLAGAVALSIIVSSRPRVVFNDPDPKPVIIDEVAGQLITFFMVPISLPSLALGFILFRFFDIVKPYPVHAMEEIEGGAGITMDDVVAGCCANLSLTLFTFCYHVIHAALNRHG
jgi:phosphatidylglycerophosphatase A